MTDEQGEAIYRLKTSINTPLNGGSSTIVDKEDIETVLNMLKEKDAAIEKKDNAVRKIIKRLDNDINRIAKSKAENPWDDYRRCRLKAYKTKTREIKEYIEEQYFERKSKR